jgi:hypothetical protein
MRLAAFVLALGLAGCAPKTVAPGTPGAVSSTATPYDTVAKAVADIAGSVNTITSTVIIANGQGLVNDADTRAILNICSTITQADAQASNLIRNLSQLTSAQQTNVWAVLKPIVATVNTSLQSGLLGIKDAATKQKVQLALVTLQGALAAVQVVLGGA